MSNARINTLAQIVGNAAAGGYTLPDNVLAAWQTFERVKVLPVGESSPMMHDDVTAAGVVTAVANGDTVNLLEVAADVARSHDASRNRDIAIRIHGKAREQAGDDAVSVAANMTESIISDCLWPALQDVYGKVREAGAALAGYGLDPLRLLDAPPKAVAAYKGLSLLVAQRSVIFQAGDAINFIGDRRRQYDSALFAEFRDPGMLTPGWSANGTARWPGLAAVAPADPAARLLWVVSDDAAPARPWLPTLAQQDERWREVFGERADRQARARSDAVAVGARGSFAVDPRVR